ncbi:MAG: YhdT family protein [Firmicutes bacterium]|nr:YhdT family protein [Bacillota bacterium]
MAKKAFEEDPRLAQCNKEAAAVLILLVLNILWWSVFAYGFGSRPVEHYTYIFGLPAWFFYSCILGYIVFSLAAYLVVRFLFKDIPLENTETSKGGEPN